MSPGQTQNQNQIDNMGMMNVNQQSINRQQHHQTSSQYNSPVPQQQVQNTNNIQVQKQIPHRRGPSNNPFNMEMINSVGAGGGNSQGQPPQGGQIFNQQQQSVMQQASFQASPQQEQ